MNSTALEPQNPYWEIAQDLDLVNLGFYHEVGIRGCQRWRLERLASHRPSLAPYIGRLLALVKDEKKLPDYYIHSLCNKLFSYACPSPAAINALVNLGTIVEIGAGSGYWARCLADAGATVYAFDNLSWKIERLWYDVKRGGTQKAGTVAADALLLCWPPYSEPMAYRALKAFQGPWVAYVGEGKEGCTGCSRFHRELDLNWGEPDEIPIGQWPGLHDRLMIYQRNTTPS